MSNENARPPCRERTFAEVQSDLAVVPPRVLKTRQQAGQTLTYIPWPVVVKMLDWAAGGWSVSYRVDGITPDRTYMSGGKERYEPSAVVVVCRLVLPCKDGEVVRESFGEEPIEVGYGGAAMRAERTALKRVFAMVSHGALALYKDG